MSLSCPGGSVIGKVQLYSISSSTVMAASMLEWVQGAGEEDSIWYMTNLLKHFIISGVSATGQ